MSTTSAFAPPDGAYVPHPLMSHWESTLTSSSDCCLEWRSLEGGEWLWIPQGVMVRGNGGEWSDLTWTACPASALAQTGRFRVGVTVSGHGEAAGLSLGAYKDFLVPLLGPGIRRRLELEIDVAGRCWAFRCDGAIQIRQWWDAGVERMEDLLNGVLALKAKKPASVRFDELTLEVAQPAICKLSIILSCYRFLQRLRITLRNWCSQTLPFGSYEVLVANPASPDGTHAYLESTASAYPHVRLREVSIPARMATNKGFMINQALKVSNGEWIWLTDADCLFAPDAGARVLDYTLGRPERTYFCERRFLTAAVTGGLITGRLDGLREFDALARAPVSRAPESAPYGYTQIAHRTVLERVRYTEKIKNFAWSDIAFTEGCQRMGFVSERIPDLHCLHLDHPFAWYGTRALL